MINSPISVDDIFTEDGRIGGHIWTTNSRPWSDNDLVWGYFGTVNNPKSASTCIHRKPFRKSTGVTCPKCGQGEIVERRSKRGTIFFGCNKYPDCDFVLWNEPINEKCPKCQSLFVKKVLKSGESIVCSKCNFKKEETDGAE